MSRKPVKPPKVKPVQSPPKPSPVKKTMFAELMGKKKGKC